MTEKQPELITREGYEKLLKELDYRVSELRPSIAQDLNTAKSYGDLSENSEFDEAKDIQSKNEERIKELENLLANVHIVEQDEVSKTKIGIGAIVSISEVDSDEVNVYTLVNQREEDIFENKLSIESPLGKALIGKKKNDIVEVKTVKGKWTYKIVKISR